MPGRKPAPPAESNGVAWQRQIREREARADGAGELFGAWWKEIDVDIGRAVVREIDGRTAATVIDRYEWLGCMPAVVWHCYGIYFDGNLGGAVVYSPEYGENLGIWDRYGWTGKIILLARGACAHWAHPHAGSKLVRQSMRLLPPRFEVVTATVDPLAGEIGTIYQACGFSYIGVMRAENPRNHTITPGRSGTVRINGRIVTGRTLRHRLGGYGKAAVRAAFPDAEFIDQPSKGRYVAFRGDKRVLRAHRAAIADLVQPYPKRGDGARDD